MTKGESLAKAAEMNGLSYTAEYLRMFDGKDQYPWTENKKHAKELNDMFYKECVENKKSMKVLCPDIFNPNAIY